MKTCSQLNSKSMKLVITGALIVATLVALFVTLPLVSYADTSSCQLIDEQPRYEPYLPSPVRSQDNKVLMRFSGYLNFSIAHEGGVQVYKYLDLKPIRLDHSSVDYDSGYRNYITLFTNCALISIQVDKDLDAEAYYLKDFTMRPIPSSVQFESCTTYPYDFKFGFRSFYSCYKSTQFDCPHVADGIFKQVSLVTKVLDLELDGNHYSNVIQGLFDKEPWDC